MNGEEDKNKKLKKVLNFSSSNFIDRFRKNSRGLSELIGYVLLVVIAISLSLLVYTWLKGYLPNPEKTKECPEGVSLIITNYYCDVDNNLLNITFQNKGLFNIDGFIIKASNVSGKLPILSLKEVGKMAEVISFAGEKGLEPNEEKIKKFSYGKYVEIFEIEIIPVRNGVLCGKASIKQDLENCN